VRLRAVAFVASLALLVTACSGGGSSKSESSTTTAPKPVAFTGGGDFYAPPDPLPKVKPGVLLRYERVPELKLGGGTAYRVMYTSRSVDDRPIAVTGIVIVPPGKAAAGSRRVVTIAHGTTGVADECAPSKNPARGELALTGPFVEAGYVVALSDYEGMGTPGRHPYLVGPSEGRGVVDAARAAAQVPGSEAGKDVAILGYSQGGHGALWANQVAARYAPELHVVGTVAGAPATELPTYFAAAAGGRAAGFVMLMVAGFNAAYPELRPDQVLTPRGVDELGAVDHGCTADVLKHYSGIGGALFRPGAAKVEPWAKEIAASNPGQVTTRDPILILHSRADDVVPVVLSQILFTRLCGLGQVVERRVYEKGQGHVGAAPDAFRDALAWINDRFAGRSPVSTCPKG
jgi:hypothetical protein